jgi:hypothetical protein
MVSVWVVFAVVLGVALLLVRLLLRKQSLDPVGAHLRDLPLGRLKSLLAGRFLVTASIGFMVDVFIGGAMPRAVVVALAMVFGAIGASMLVMRSLSIGKRLLVIVPLAAIVGGFAMSRFHRS